MPQNPRFTRLTSFLCFLGCLAGLAYLSRWVSSECFSPEVLILAVLSIGLGTLAVREGVVAAIAYFRPIPDEALPDTLREKVDSLNHLLSDTNQQLQDSEERFRTSIETMLDCFGIYRAIRDEQGTILDFRVEFVNQAACLNNQMSPEEQLGKGLCELLSAHRDSGLFDEYCQVVETGQPLIKDALFYEDQYGQNRLVRAFDIRAAKLGDGFVATWRDVTVRHQIEEELRHSEARLRSILENMPVMLDAFDATGNIIAWNQECERVTGYTAEEVIGNNGIMEQLYPNAPYCQQQIDQWNQRGDDYRNWEWELTCKDGSVRTIAWSNIAAECPVPGWATWGIGVDVTERKRTETALKQSEAIARARASELEAFMEAVPAGVWIAHDPQCHHVTPNRAAYEMMRRLPDSVMTATPANGEYPFQFKIQQNSQDIALEDLPMQQAGRTGQSASGEFEFVFEDGEVCSLYGKAVPVRYESGEIRGVIGAFIDITSRKQAEAALQESQARLELALDAARIGSWDWDLETNEVVWTPYHEMIFGYEPGNPKRTYQEWCDRVHPDDLPVVQASLRQAMEEKRDYACDYRAVWTDSSIHWVSSYGRFHYDSNGKPTRMLGMLFDISERKQTEAALQESEFMFRTLADTMPQLFWVVRSDGYHEYSNQRWYNYTGLSLEQAHRQGVHQIMHPDDLSNTVKAFDAALETGTMFTTEHRLRRAKDGEYRWHLSQALPLYDPNGQVVKWFGSSTDIHDQKLVIEERAQALERERAARMALERASRMKDEFLAVVSHELRSPLNAILGWSRLLRTRTFEPQRTEQALAAIERNAQAQTQLIEDLLDISRIIRGKIRLELHPTNLIPCVQAAMDTIRPAATAKSIALSFYSALDADFVSGDPERLQQIVWNLLSNAVKFTPTGGQIDVYVQSVNQMAQIQVIDSGKGISPDFLPYVFERFRQEDATSTRTQGGLGLGLAIVRNLVELHGGSIGVDSAGDGQGTTFTVEFPLLSAALQEHSANYPGLHRQTITDTLLALSNINVLVVDDEEDTREFLQVALEQYGAKVITAASAAEAWQLLQTHNPDVLLSDVGMPEEDGFMLIRRIRALPPHQGGQIPAAALTAYAREGDRLQALAAGFQMHIPKPIEPMQLLTVIMRLLESGIEVATNSNMR
ncbi:PAS domain S-box protein [Allocoleopsis sp.]|uniref:hybrid sensor histidine kinase/response regulator n=1 Tax=Allocoleopsis sp. TaxID=3088169 RepID=UPI002FD5389F